MSYRVSLPIAVLFSLVAAIITYYAMDRTRSLSLDLEAEWVLTIAVWVVAYAIVFIPVMAAATYKVDQIVRAVQRREDG
jgi:hypothetical protein